MRFAKLHGLGNDFVLLDLRSGGEPLPAARAVALCDRHRGIGADGVLTLLPGDRMLVQNSDGSVPEMCGNGARCAALWMLTDRCTRPGSGTVRLLTDAGPRPCVVTASSAVSGLVEVDMGVAELSAPRRVGTFEALPVSMGNPHRVIFGDPKLAASEGPALCSAENANIEFASRVGQGRYEVGVYERGAGLTQACGTGACAVAAAAVARGEVQRGSPVSVRLPGGELTLTVDADDRVRMRGPAELVFVGELP
ncbi:MAG: diaminopimelate epimerase [Myxococcales bacterium]|nr:diaminopimelate epimerase [Myxococcales bacterium]